MTSGLQVDPHLLVNTATGHLEYFNSLGQLIDLGPPPNDWPSSAGVAASRQAKNAMTADMMAQMGQHSATLGANAGQFQAQETKSSTALAPDKVEAMFGDFMKNGENALGDLGKNVEAGVANFGQVGVAVGGTAATTTASAGSSFMGKISPPAAAAHVTPTAGTSEAAAPGAGHDDDGRKHDGTHAEQRP